MYFLRLALSLHKAFAAFESSKTIKKGIVQNEKAYACNNAIFGIIGCFSSS